MNIDRIKSYRNLNARKLDNGKRAVEWSILPKRGELANKVFCYASCAVLTDVLFKIDKGKADKIVRLNKRTVCAWVEGAVASMSRHRERLEGDYQWNDEHIKAQDFGNMTRITYRALQGDYFFITADKGQPVTAAEIVILEADGSCWASGLTFA